MASLNTPTTFYTDAVGINDSGQIVGTFRDASGRFHGFSATPTPGA